MDECTKIFIQLCRIFFADKGETTTKLAIYYLEQLKDILERSENFPKLKELKKELDLYL